MENKKSSIIIKRDIFRILAAVMLIVSVACGFLLAKTEVRSLTVNLTIVEETVFEWWRFILFTFVGVFGSGCFLGISAVFNELEKLKNKKSK